MRKCRIGGVWLCFACPSRHRPQKLAASPLHLSHYPVWMMCHIFTFWISARLPPSSRRVTSITEISGSFYTWAAQREILWLLYIFWPHFLFNLTFREHLLSVQSVSSRAAVLLFAYTAAVTEQLPSHGLQALKQSGLCTLFKNNSTAAFEGWGSHVCFLFHELVEGKLEWRQALFV